MALHSSSRGGLVPFIMVKRIFKWPAGEVKCGMAGIKRTSGPSAK